MMTIEIHDEQFARRLREIAAREDRPVEDVLKALLEHYAAKPATHDRPHDASESVRQVYLKAYAKARLYWQSVSDTAKAALTDEELAEQFGAFDEEGIPRLKSALKSLEPPVGSLAYAAKRAREANIRLGNSLDVERADDILNEEFADYILSRQRRENTAE